MDADTIARMILDASFKVEDPEPEDDPTDLAHADNASQTVDTSDSADGPDTLSHYGILGMKWGVRRTPEQLGHTTKEKRPKGYRRGETSKEYAERMKREEREKAAKRAEASEKRQIRAQAKEQKRELKSREKREARVLRSQEKEQRLQFGLQKQKQEKEQVKTKAAKTPSRAKIDTKMMTDEELQAAIRRLQMERQYKDLAKKPDNPAVKLGKSIMTSAATQVASKYIAAYATKGVEELIKKSGKESPLKYMENEKKKEKEKENS